MAQLKSSIVTGSLRVTDAVITDTVQASTVKAPTTSGGTTYGTGDSGQVLTTNGTSVYWGSLPEGVSPSTTTPKMDGTATVGTETAFARGDHIHPTDTSRAPLASPALTGTPTAPTATAGTNTTQIATTAFVKTAVDGISVPVATTTTPKMDGTAAVGSETKWAKGDHVHPTDTSRAASSHAHGNITNAGAITATGVALANNDTLVFVDSSDSSKLKQTSIKFDGSTATKALTQKGTFETFLTQHQDLSAYAPLASPALTGTPTAPTATDGDNSTQIATTAYVDNHDVPYMKVVPMQSKTYTGVIGTANNWAGATFFFGSIRPTSFYETWSIKLRLRAVSGGVNNSKLLSDIVINGSYNSLTAYSCFNSVINTSYRAVYYVELYRLKEAGFNAGYGHALGIRLYSAWNPTTAANARTVDIEIYECINCSFEFFDAMTPYASIPGTGTTNYDTYSELNVADNGLQETGDANATYAYQIRRYNGTYLAKEKVVRYIICIQCSDTELLPMNSTDNTIAATKTMTTGSFNPFGQIFYYATTTNVNAGAAFGTTNLYTQNYNIDGRYSFNWASTLTAQKSIYIVCSPQSDGSVKLAETPWSQELPTTEDGYVYIYLGEATSTYQFLLEEVHPVYYFKDGAIRLWTNPTTVIETKETVPATESSPLIKVGSEYYLWK